MTATILSKRAVLALWFLVLAVVIIVIPMLFVKAHQDEQFDDLFPPDRWQEVASIVSDLNKHDDTWILSSVPPSGLSYFTTSWIVPSGGVVGVNVYGHSDDGGYCLAYWGGSAPGWVAEYRHDGQDGRYNIDSKGYSPCPTYPPSFDSSGNAQICQGTSGSGPFAYGKNSLGEDKGDISNGISIPAGTVINLKADNVDGGGDSNVHCYLEVKYPSVISGYSSEYFPSNSSNFYVGTASDSTILCPDEAYVSGLRRWHTGGDEDPVAVYCSWQPLGQLKLPSASQGVAAGSRRADGVDLCANGSNGYYMAGINHDFSSGSGDKDPTQIYCAPAPSDYASGFQSTTNSATSSPMNNNNTLYTCDDGYYMSGIDRSYSGSGDQDEIQIYCSLAPIIPADIGESCSSQPCGYGFICNSSNICVIPPPSRVDANGSSCELNSSGPEWTANYKPESGGAAYGYATAVDSAGNIYVTGEAFNAVSDNSGLDMFVSKYNSSGSRLWTEYYDDNGNEAGYGVAVVADGSAVYVVGRKDAQNTDDEIPLADKFVKKYDANGKDLWNQTITSGRAGTDLARSVAVDSLGNVYVAGYYQHANSSDIDAVIWKFDPSGNFLYLTPYDIGANESAYGIALDSSNNIYITGYQSTGGADMFLRKHDTSLKLIGSFGGGGTFVYDSGNNQTDIGRGVSVSQDGNTVFVTGYQSSGGGDMFLNAYRVDNGASAWSEVYNSGGSQNDVGRAVVADRAGAGRVYVAGSQGTNSDDVFLQEYFSSDYQGFLQNTLISDLPYQDIAYGIAIGPASDNEPVYVSGYRASNGGEAFLSKYSCNAPTGAGVTSNGYFIVSPVNKYVGTTISVDATQSGPGISEYEWDWSYDGSSFNVESGEVKSTNANGYQLPGPYVIALQITYSDTTRQPEIFTQRIDVYDNHQPTASFSVTPSTGPAPLVVTVNGAGSDPDGSDVDPGDYIKNFIWNWGDGTPNGQGQQTTHLYSRPGDYIISLVVEDSVGASNSFSAPFTQTVTVTEQYVCSGGCGADAPVCGPTNDGLATQCYQCLSDTDCGSGYRCLGISCKQGQMCSDGLTECPADGRCPEATSCKVGDVCSDGSACPASEICDSQNNKNTCVLSSDTQEARCYTEGVSAGCATDLDCTASLQGGTCDTATGECRYARCLNETSFTCESDKDCNNSDGICLTGTGLCDYIYDCAYGPGMNDGATTTAAVLAPAVPAMPIGIQPDGEACTKPTPDAPNNCEGINGCLYYNYNGDGTVVAGDANNLIGSSVASCLNKFEDGTGCVYYGNQSIADSRVNCLPGTDFAKLKSKTAPDGVPAGCVVMDKGSGKKEYDCTGVNNCYYYLNGVVDCDYMGGTGCIYEPNPAGAAFCPRAFKTPTGGENFVQCLLNPDATLPSFLLGSSASGLSTCSTGADCPAGAPVCINGTCYPVCQGDVDCVTGGVCLDECDTDFDCDGNLVCNGVCQCPLGTVLNPISGLCELITNPDSFRCLDTTAVHKLDYDTSPADIAVRSSQNASCRWSLFDLSFADMVSPVGFPFNTNDLISHTASAVGFPSAGPSTIFVACDNGAGATASCNVPLTLSDPCGTNADCRGDLVCIDGWCQAPVCADAQPQGSLPYSALSDGTPISMTTTVDSDCVYSDTYSDTNQCVAPILSCSTAASFATTGGTTHSSFLSPPLVVGNNYQYVKCQETAPPQSLSTTCTIPVRVLTCNPYAVVNECDNDWVCAGIGSGPGICIPPDCSGAKPTGTLPYTADNADIGMTTSVPATCAYSDNPNDSYNNMTAFTETGDLAHLSNIPVERNSDVYRYAICNETATDEKTDVCTIRFKVGDLLPICGGAYPRGRQDVNVELPIGLNTNQSAVCKFADVYDNLVTPGERYDNMANTFRRTIDGLMHGRDGVLQDTVVVVQGDNTKYVACREDSVPNKITECRIPFSGGSCKTSFDCALGMVCNPTTRDCTEDPCLNSDPSDDPPGGCIRCVGPDCRRSICDIDPSLPQCNPEPNFCAMNPDAPECQTSCNTLGYEFFNQAVRPSGNCDIVAIIMALLSWLAWIVALLAVLSGLRAAYLYITSAGDEKKLRLAYQYLIYTTIGVGVAIITFSLVAITRAILNI